MPEVTSVECADERIAFPSGRTGRSRPHRTYDAIVVGSGAAGGMAAHVLTSQGLKVLLLEAGKKIDIETELQLDASGRTTIRAAARCRRDTTRCRSTSTTSASRPTPQDTAYKHVYSYVGGWGGSDYSQEHRRRREGPPVHRHQLRVGARAAARRQDEHLGPPRAAPLRLRLQGQAPRRLRRGLADLLRRHRAVLRQGRSATSASPGVKENLPHLPDSMFQRPTS